MEVKQGYKKTEAGTIPEEWEARKLGDLATFRTGPFGSTLHKSDYTNDGIPVINPMHIVDGQIVPAQSMTITEEAAAKLSEFRLKPGEIIIGRRGDMGRCAIIQDHHRGWICGTGSMIIRPSSGLTPEFLQRVLSSPSIVSAIEESSVGSTMVNLNQGNLGKLTIQSPPASEQRAIAAALSDVDALLAKLDQLIAKKRDLKQATMQQLLTGRTRLPGYSKGAWVVRRLGEACRITTGKKDVNEGNPKGQFPFFTCSRSHTFSDSYTFDMEAILIAGNGDVGNLHYFNGKFEAYQRTYVLYEFSVEVRYLWQQLCANLAESLGVGKIGSSIPYINRTYEKYI